MFLISTIFGIAAAFFGRWLQFTPGKIIVQGTFEGSDAPNAVLSRKVIAIGGTVFVFMGTMGIFSLSFPFESELLSAIAFFVGSAAGIAASIHVRREVSARLKIVPGQFGLWP